MSAASSKKRKFAEPKFYAVKAGHSAGIYTEWEDCKAQITGFKGAVFKSFPTRSDAQAFIEGRDIMISASDGPKIDKYYGVAVGLVPGVYTDWPTAEKQIRGVKGPKFKKFTTSAEAAEFVRCHGQGTPQLMKSGDGINVIRAISSKSAGEPAGPPRKSRKVDTASGSKLQSEKPITNVFQSRSSYASSVNPTALRIYTDGSSLGNGQNGASAGVGVFFGIGDERNISEPLLGSRQTNQRAELTAIVRALEVVPITRAIQIVTDSQYSINCVTKWYAGWEQNGWMNSKKEPVENQDLIMAILAKIRERQRGGVVTDFIWIKGHSQDPGNDAADRLAVAGARKG